MSNRPNLGDSIWLLYVYCLMATTKETFTNVELAQLLRAAPATITIWQATLERAGAIQVKNDGRIIVMPDFLGPVHVKPRVGWGTDVGRWPSVAPDVTAAIDKEFLKKCGIKEK